MVNLLCERHNRVYFQADRMVRLSAISHQSRHFLYFSSDFSSKYPALNSLLLTNAKSYSHGNGTCNSTLVLGTKKLKAFFLNIYGFLEIKPQMKKTKSIFLHFTYVHFMAK